MTSASSPAISIPRRASLVLRNPERAILDIRALDFYDIGGPLPCKQRQVHCVHYGIVGVCPDFGELIVGDVAVPACFFVTLDALAGILKRRIAPLSRLVVERLLPLRTRSCNLAPNVHVLANMHRLNRINGHVSEYTQEID
jgi:hypothetical protein